MNRRTMLIRHLSLLLLAACLLTGCQSGLGFGLFVKDDRTSFHTPTFRMEEARAIAAQATGENTPEQQELVNQLARRIQTESDPLVRETIVTSIAAFPMPLADQVLTAGLTDPDPGVRRQCCQSLGARRSPSGATALAAVLAEDENFDVRIAATRALGELKTPEATRALVTALEDNDPAMQFAGVEATRNATGRDLGGNVEAYLALAKGDEATAIATRPEEPEEGFFGRLSPF